MLLAEPQRSPWSGGFVVSCIGKTLNLLLSNAAETHRSTAHRRSAMHPLKSSKKVEGVTRATQHASPVAALVFGATAYSLAIFYLMVVGYKLIRVAKLCVGWANTSTVQARRRDLLFQRTTTDGDASAMDGEKRGSG